MDKATLKEQRKLAEIFFEMGMDEDVVSAISGLSKEETNNIKKNKEKIPNKKIDSSPNEN